MAKHFRSIGEHPVADGYSQSKDRPAISDGHQTVSLRLQTGGTANCWNHTTRPTGHGLICIECARNQICQLLIISTEPVRTIFRAGGCDLVKAQTLVGVSGVSFCIRPVCVGAANRPPFRILTRHYPPPAHRRILPWQLSAVFLSWPLHQPEHSLQITVRRVCRAENVSGNKKYNIPE